LYNSKSKTASFFGTNFDIKKTNTFFLYKITNAMQNFLPFSTKNHLKTVIITFIAAFLLFGASNAYATHALGADLSYTHISGNTYRFSMSFYRDCSGIAAPNIFTATVNGCGNTSATFTLTQTSGFEDISPACATAQSTCTGGTVAGTQRYVYEGFYTFPSVCTDWNVSVSHCCRNNSSTVAGASNYNLYVQVNLNNTVANSSPAFAQSPALYACVNQLFSYNNILIDAEGDSLVYALANPLSAANLPINYITGFSAAQPLSVTAAGFNLNNQTGQLSFMPTTVGQVSILVFEIKEYRNAALISTLRRDVQIIVVNCGANNTPIISSPTAITGATFTASQNSGDFRVCVGQPMSFNIKTSDADTAQILNVLTNVSANFPNAVVSIFLGVGNELVINFQWTPTSNDIGTRLLRIESRDNNCPIYGATVNGFTITVVGVKAKASVQTLCKGTPTTINLTTDAPTIPNGIYEWTAVPSVGTLPNTQSITAEVTQNTVFTVQYLDNICNATDTVIIKAYGGVTATPATVANYCPTDAPIQLEAVYGNPSPALTPLFSWSVVPAASGAVSDANIANPTATAVAAANGTTVRYVVTANDGRCTSKDTVTVAVNCANCFTNVTIDAPLGTTLNCIQTSLTLNANATGSNGTRSFAWSNGATTTGIVVSSPGIYVVTVTNTLANGSVCTSTQSVVITQDNVLPISSLTKNSDLTCINTSVTLSASSNSTNDQFFWNTGETIANITVNQPNTYTVFVTGVNGCSSSASIAVTQNRVVPIVTVTGNTSFCVGTSTVLTADISNGIGTYLWSTGANLAATSVNTAGTYTVTATRTDNGCKASQQRTVSLRLRPNVSITQNPIACIGEPTTLTATGGTAYTWNTGATSAALALPNPTLTTTYIVTVTGANGCTNIADITVQFLSPGVCVGTENRNDLSATIRLFPNPTDTYFNLIFDTKWLDATITVTDMTGRTVLTTQKSLISANETLDFAINDWAAGVYFIDIKNNNQKARLKMVKMR
jgi:Secretion system C-terminal sorting domain